MATLPTIMGIDGLQPQDPTELRKQLVDSVSAEVPGYTADLPGSLIEDITSTSVGAIALLDQARVELVNSLTPFGANQFILNQLGVQTGVFPNTPTNTSVDLIFTGTPGFLIAKGFVVSDGTNQFVTQEVSVIRTLGTSSPVHAVSTTPGPTVSLANTVTGIITSVPPGVSLTVTNPSEGIPGTPGEAVEAYRSRVLESYKIPALGMPTAIRAGLKAVPGVNPRLVSVIARPGGSWSVVVGGGNSMEVASAIFANLLNINRLTGSITSPSTRDVTVSLTDFPDVYNIIFIRPPAEVTTMIVTWNTTAIGAVSDEAVSQDISAAAVNYINNLHVGEPINVAALQSDILSAVNSIVPQQLISRLVIAITVNGVAVSPAVGTTLIAIDPEVYLTANSQGITVIRG